MSESIKHVATLGNSIIGVSVLAMPFCFKQCGILLGTLMLIASALLTRFNCHLLLKGAFLSRRKTYELFAFYCFGYYGKLIVESSIIGFLVGILISFFVVIGDLGPPIISKSFEIENLPPLRTLVLTALGIGVALPLGLLKNITSLGGISTLSILFYIALVIKVFFEAVPVLTTSSWIDKVTFWQPQGILQSLPIFALALSCQTQIFEISNALPDSNLGKMNKVIKMAVYLCTTIYICVGFFGYVAFCNEDFSGNVLVMMPSTFMTQLIKLGFVVSVVLSFPLVIFPCRASLYSLFNRKVHTALDSGVSAFIPESRFRWITVGLVVSTLILGILCPNIELVLGIVGSTIGTVICIIFPALMFIRVTTRNTFERTGAQVVFCVGVFLLVASTFVTLNNSSLEVPSTHKPTKIELHPDLQLKYESIIIPVKSPVPNQDISTKKMKEKLSIIESQVVKENIEEKINTIPQVDIQKEQIRQEPLVLNERHQEPLVPNERRQESLVPNERRKEPPVPQEEQIRQEPPVPQEEEKPQKKKIYSEEKIGLLSSQISQEERQEPPIPQEPISVVVKEPESRQEPRISQDVATKKEEDVIKLEPISVVPETKQPVAEREKEKGKVKEKIKEIVIDDKPNEVAVQQAEILKQLAEQQKESQKLIQEQKQVLEELKAHKELHKPEERVENKVIKEDKKNSTEERRNVVVELLEKRREKMSNENEIKKLKANNSMVQVNPKEEANKKIAIENINTIQPNIKLENKKVEDFKQEKTISNQPLKPVVLNETQTIQHVAQVIKAVGESKAEIR